MLNPSDDGRERRSGAESGNLVPGSVPDQPVRRARDGRRISEKSLQNLPNLRGEAGAASWKPGDSPHLRHGARTRRPQGSPEWSPAVQAAIGDLEARVGDELRDESGELYAWALPSVEALAIARVAAWRIDRFVADRETRGLLAANDIELQSKIAARYHDGLAREALTLASRLQARATSFDLAQAMSALEDEEKRDA